jgi:hypothetical protein
MQVTKRGHLVNELHFAPETVEACLSTNYKTVSVKLSAIHDNSEIRVVLVVGHYN